MAIPDFQSFFRPLLEAAADGQEHSLKDAREKVAKSLQLSEEEISEMLPSGVQRKFDNRIAWAKSYFIQAGVFKPTRRGWFQITDRGRQLLEQGHERIDIKVLNQYPEFIEFHATPKPDNTGALATEPQGASETPEEVLQQAYSRIRADLADDLLARIKDNSPAFFEKLVVDLMVAMGYGGSRADAGKSIGQAGDEGIDGIIKEDRLGLDVIYLQAKRWDGTVGRPDIQKFVGALHGKRARKGVFITTGKFSEEARRYVENIDPKVILIDGRTLAEYMIDYDLGTTTFAMYPLKRVDSDYFTEE